MSKSVLIAALLTSVLIGCKSSDKGGSANMENEEGNPSKVVVYNNPPAEGFDFENSTPHAIVLADQIMNAMGGREKWDATNVISWNFFGARTLLWDKENNRVRVDWPRKDMVIALDMNDMSGKVWRSGDQLTNQDSVAHYLKRGKSMWINDSYWLAMPFKLKDSGVALNYMREDTTLVGGRSDVLRLTFSEVGLTPQNAYEIWVDYDTRLVEQWAYFANAEQEEPNFVLPWTNYQDYNGLLISGERGDRDLTNIKVLDKVPAGAFDNPELPSL